MIDPAILQLLLATMTSAGIVLAAVLPAVISTRRKAATAATAATSAATSARTAVQKTEAATFAVTNGHEEHIRDAMDRQHAELTGMVGALKDDLKHVRDEQTGMKSDIRGIRRDVGRLADQQQVLDNRQQELAAQQRAIEDTIPHPAHGVPNRKKGS